MNPGSHPDRACRDADTELFYPSLAEIAEARQVIAIYCANCPVMAECLEFAMKVEGKASKGARAGIFGGTTPYKRHQIYEARRKAGMPEPLAPINHGTRGGFKTHKRRGERPCESCAQAESRRRRDRERAA